MFTGKCFCCNLMKMSLYFLVHFSDMIGKTFSFRKVSLTYYVADVMGLLKIVPLGRLQVMHCAGSQLINIQIPILPIKTTVGMHAPAWSGNHTNKNHLCFVPLNLCGYVWVYLMIFQVLLTNIYGEIEPIFFLYGPHPLFIQTYYN